ncbi:DUF6292 family protein [Amycolatopsis albispora]|uniref:DUF6292 domain-containing protein n=1 Tax=Amycolatopsis albispora TaxID=1804986 RepID=A0A344L1Y8_9PSEU|nr:DUF6292 family protein [Amycolatopsis albispora]AXB42062.1 hypothetical protein A4R43_05570 [Amycolatopsis albispora]
MSSLIDSDVEYRFNRGLRGYLEAVTSALGIGLESCTVDLDTPVSAYIAIDWRLARFPGRDVALIWDEQHGWAATIEAGCGEDVIVLAYLGGDEVLPDPRQVVRFLAALRADDHSLGQPDPPGIRQPGNHDELLDRLG